MDTAAAERAAELLWVTWQRGQLIDTLPPDCCPASIAEGWQVQRALDQLAPPRIGWKIAGSSKAGQEHIGIDRPIVGALYAGSVFPSGSTLPLRPMQVAEAEFAFEFAHDLAPSGAPHSRDTVFAAVGEMRLAVEVPDSRFTDYVAAGAAQMTAECACAAALVLGEPVWRWAQEDLPDHRVAMWRNGDEIGVGKGSNALGDPCDALVWLVNELAIHGVGLSAGDVVITGTCAPPLHVERGDQVRADFGTYGFVELAFD